jgi:uncharacterized integral membrane protein
MRRAKWIVMAVIAVLVLTIIFQNTSVVTFRVLFWEISMSRVVFLLVALVVGFLLGLLFPRIWRARARPARSGNATPH